MLGGSKQTTSAECKTLDDDLPASPLEPWLPVANQAPIVMSSWLGCEGNVCFSWSNTCWIVLPAAHHSPRFPVKLRIDRTGVLAVPIAVRRWRKNPHVEPTMVGRNPLNRSRSSRDKQARGAVPQAPARTTVRTVLVLASKANTAKKTDHHQYSNAARRIQTGMIAIATEDLVHIQNITNHYILYHNPPSTKYQGVTKIGNFAGNTNSITNTPPKK